MLGQHPRALAISSSEAASASASAGSGRSRAAGRPTADRRAEIPWPMRYAAAPRWKGCLDRPRVGPGSAGKRPNPPRARFASCRAERARRESCPPTCASKRHLADRRGAVWCVPREGRRGLVDLGMTVGGNCSGARHLWSAIAGCRSPHRLGARDEFPGGGEHGLRLIAMWRMATGRQRQQSRVGNRRGDARDLLHRSVFIVLALDREDRDSGSTAADASMFQPRNAGSSQIRFQPQKAESTSA